MKNFIQPGNMLTVTAAGAVSSGDLLAVGAIIGVAAFDAAVTEQVELGVEGVFSLLKLSPAATIAAGALVYLDTGKVTTAGSGKPLVGVAVKDSGAGVATVEVKLGMFGTTGAALMMAGNFNY